MGLASCGQNTADFAPPLHASVAAELDTAFVTRGVVESLDILPGITRSPTEAVRLESGSGRIGAIYAWPGDRVAENQVLARLDTSHIEAQIENLEESMQRSRLLNRLRSEEMALEIAILELSLSEALSAQQDTPGEQAASNIRRLRERIAWLRLDRDQLQRRHALDIVEVEAALQRLRENLGNMEIRAAFDGEVVYTMGIGTWVNTNDPVMYIARLQGVFVEYIGRPLNVVYLRNGVRMQGVIGGRVFDLELIPTTIEEQLYYSRRDLASPIRFEILAGLNDMPPPGEAVFIHFYTAWADDVLRIPGNALFPGAQGESFVYRLEEGRQIQVHVTVGLTTESFAEILEGLSEWDEVFVRP
jgi:multidrug efflux pump subunit AcrA (membrane-fusion protein)